MDIYASDDEKGEEIKQWWRDNGRSVIAACILGALILISGRYWLDYKNTQSAHGSQAYQSVLLSLSSDEKTAAEDTTEQLFREFSNTPYAVFSAFEMATQAVEDKNNAAAQMYLEWIINNAKLSAHKELAQLRLAQSYFLGGEYEQALKLADGQESTAFSSLWSELQGDIYVAQEKVNDARKAYLSALSTSSQGEPRQQILRVKLDDVVASDNV